MLRGLIPYAVGRQKKEKTLQASCNTGFDSCSPRRKGIIEETNPTYMKNEPVVSYDHMQEESSLHAENHSRHSFNLYLLFAVDVLVISAIVVAAFKIIF